jgi:hypothetical protein
MLFKGISRKFPVLMSKITRLLSDNFSVNLKTPLKFSDVITYLLPTNPAASADVHASQTTFIHQVVHLRSTDTHNLGYIDW